MIRFVIRKITILNSEQRGSKFIGGWEYKHTGGILYNFLNQLHPLHGFDPGLHKGCSLGIKPKLIDKTLHVLEFHLLALKLFFLALSVFDSQLLESIVVASVVLEFFAVEVDYFVAGYIEELSGVGDYDNGVLAGCDVVL